MNSASDPPAPDPRVMTPGPQRSRSTPRRTAWHLERRGRLVYFRLPVRAEHSPDSARRSGSGLTCIFTTRSGGVSQGAFEGLNLAYGYGDDPESVGENLERLRMEFGIKHLVTLKQMHSKTVLYINYEKIPADVLEGDALFTDQPGIALGIKVADCLPVYILSRDGSVIGLAHAGWRGTRGRVAVHLVSTIQRKLGMEPRDLCFAFGPCIGPRCYEVGAEIVHDFQDFPAPGEFLKRAPDQHDPPKFLLDLKTANRQILSPMGLSEVGNLNKCTHCSPALFYSARRDKTTGRNLALVVRH
jgi:hypothetical protein